MKRTNWFNRETRKIQARRQTFRPAIEQLESRCLLNATATEFRPISEIGNNIDNPNIGTANTDLLRISPAAYKPNVAAVGSPPNGDGLNTPSLTYGSPTFIAGPRLVSNVVSNQATELFGPTDINTVDGNGLSDFGYTFGQFIDHDMDLTPGQSALPPNDPAFNKDGPNGFPIPKDPTNPNDPIAIDAVNTLAFTRSVFDPATGITGPREQINVSTSYLDLSQVYGSTDVVANALRTHSSGLLKSSPGADGIVGTGDDLLPFNTTAALAYNNNTPYFTQADLDAFGMANDAHLVASTALFVAGDPRANETTELTAFQTLFMRNHNQIATQLAQQNPNKFGFTSWTDENLYQEARKLNIAQYQNIVYTQYLPNLLGSDALPAYQGYDAGVDPSISTEFSTVGFRFGHSMLNNFVQRDNNNGESVGAVPLALTFFNPTLLTPGGSFNFMDTVYNATDIGAVLKGDADHTAQAVDVMAVSAIRNLLFGQGGQGEDLIARDMWRVDDHGIGTYNQLRVAYGLDPITDTGVSGPGEPFRFHGFEQISSDPEVVQKLIQAFTGPTREAFLPGVDGIAGTADDKFAGDIHPFIAGLAEDHVGGSDMGPLFTRILADQFARLRDGDRFFYLNQSFTAQERKLLKQGDTLAELITANTNITNLQEDVFKFEASISGKVTISGDSHRDDGRGAAGITVQITDANGNVLGTTVTDSQGRYSFDQQNGVTSTGVYRIVVVLPAGVKQSKPESREVRVTAGGAKLKNVNFRLEALDPRGDDCDRNR